MINLKKMSIFLSATLMVFSVGFAQTTSPTQGELVDKLANSKPAQEFDGKVGDAYGELQEKEVERNDDIDIDEGGDGAADDKIGNH